MRKTLFSFLVVALLSFGALAQETGQEKAKVKKTTAPAAPKSDAEIQTCINDKFKNSATVKNGNATVSGGVATLTGEAKNGGAKGAATGIAKRCGATSVTNNMTIAPRPPAPPKKP